MNNQVPLHQFVARTLVRRVLQFALLVAIYFVTAWALPHLGVVDSVETAPPGELNIVQRPSKAERLIEKHDCWTGKAPTSAVPTHAVVTSTSGVTRYADSGPALAHLFKGADNGVETVHGFCR